MNLTHEQRELVARAEADIGETINKWLWRLREAGDLIPEGVAVDTCRRQIPNSIGVITTDRIHVIGVNFGFDKRLLGTPS